MGLWTHHERPNNAVATEYTKLQLEHENDIDQCRRDNAQHDGKIIKSIKTRKQAMVGRCNN